MRPWVFDKLVNNGTDLEGLLAYSLYKYQKSELASQLRASQMLEADIQLRIKTLHDNVAASPLQLQSFRDNAAILLNRIVTNSEQPWKDKFNQEVSLRASKVDKEVQKRLDKFSKSIISEAKKAGAPQAFNQKYLYPFFLWLLSGVPSALATVLIGALTLMAVLLITTSRADKIKSVDAALSEVKSVIIGIDNSLKNDSSSSANNNK